MTDTPDNDTQPGGPLAGMRVLDVATVLAGPFGATLLADYGAEVVKVELPGRGDGLRGFPPFKDGKSLWWKTSQRNKQCVTLDLRQARGAEILKAMLPHFDLLIENFRPGTLDNWGLGREVLWQANPQLVIMRVSAFGQSGPYRGRPGFARIFEAMGGLTAVSGAEDGEPMHTGAPLGDLIGGLYCAVGALAALWRRQRDPQCGGEEIDLSLTESILRLLDVAPAALQQLGQAPARLGNRSPYSAPSAVYRTQDGHWVTMAGSINAMFANNCAAIGRADLLRDPRFATNADRVRHERELNGIFAHWCAARPLAEVIAAFAAADGTMAPVYTIDQVVRDPQMVAREAIVSAHDEDFGALSMPNVVPRFARRPASVRHAGRSIGADNATVYMKYAGLGADDLRRLEADGVI